MKKLFLLAVAVLMLSAGAANAQSFKFGHIDTGKLLQAMPDRLEAQSQLEKHAKMYEDQMLAMQTEFEKKYKEYQEQAETLTPVIRESKESELAEIQQRFQAFRQTAQQEVSNKEAELMQPIIEKAKKAIDDVAAENNFTYVFDISTGSLVYFNESQSVDILPMVFAKLGIK